MIIFLTDVAAGFAGALFLLGILGLLVRMALASARRDRD